MGTKLKRYNILLKTLCIIVFIISAMITAFVTTNIFNIYNNTNCSLSEITETENYYETSNFEEALNSAEYNINSLYLMYTDYDAAVSYVAYETNEEILEKFNQETDYEYSNDVWYLEQFNEFDWNTQEAGQAIVDFQATYSDDIDELLKKNIEKTQKNIIQGINEVYSGGLVYFFTTPDGSVISNTSFTTADDFGTAYSTINSGDVNYSYYDNTEYQFAFTQDYLTNKFIIPFEEAKDSYNSKSPQIIISSLIMMITCLSYIVFAAGRKNNHQIHMLKIDKIYVDFNVVILALTALAFVSTLYIDIEYTKLLLILFSCELAIFLTLFLSLVRHVKNGTFFKHMFIRKVASRIWRKVKIPLTALKALIVHPTTNRISLIIMIVVGSIVMVLCFGRLIFNVGYSYPYYIIFKILLLGLMIVFPIATYQLYKHIIEFEKLSEFAKKIKSGKYDEKIEVNFTKEYNEFADNLNDISSGLTDEVDRRLKSERLKTDLITNVSHDLKTPLTSFITYVDLLKKENIEDEKIKGYVDVLDQKSARLKVLVDDLVDSAKASSGNVKVTLEKVEVNSLISQSLGELDDVISKSKLDFRLKMPNEKLYVHADGKLLWRVVNNLIDNILKYSLPNTRVYINIFEKDGEILLEFKNISADELNISEDELMDRFVRGDESRNTKGSGLGLNIAKSLMVAQNGELSVSIDGDAFKAVVKILKY